MMDEEIRQALSEVREMKQMCGNINMKLTNIVTQRGQDWKKKLEAEYQRGLEEGYERGLAEGKKAFDLLDAERDAEYQRGLRDGVNAPRVGDEAMRSYSDKGVITNVDYVEELASIMWNNGKCSREGLYTYSTTGMTYDIKRILRGLNRKG